MDIKSNYDNYLSFLSFTSNQEFNSPEKHGHREHDCDILRKASDGGLDTSRYRAESKDEKRWQNEPAFVAAEYIAGNEQSQSDAGKLPSIHPVFGKQKNGSKKGRKRVEFSCIDVGDFSIRDKPVMTNVGRDTKETTRCSNNLPSPGRRADFPGEEKWENNSVVKTRLADRESIDSASSCKTFVHRPRQLSLGNYTTLPGREDHQRAIFSPPAFCSKPGRPSGLSEKFTKFLETEYSIIKAERVDSSEKYRLRSVSVPTQQRGPLFGPPNPKELKEHRSLSCRR